MKKILSTTIASLTLLSGIALSQPASAAVQSGIGYACNVTLAPPPQSPAYGASGYITLNFNSSTDCSPATVVRSLIFYSAGASPSLKNPAYFYNEATFMALYRSLVDGAKDGTKILYQYDTSYTVGSLFQGMTAGFVVQ
jgi:hypothetical protein